MVLWQNQENGIATPSSSDDETDEEYQENVQHDHSSCKVRKEHLSNNLSSQASSPMLKDNVNFEIVFSAEDVNREINFNDSKGRVNGAAIRGWANERSTPV